MEPSDNVISIAVPPTTMKRLADVSVRLGGMEKLASLLVEWLDQQSPEQQKSILDSTAAMDLTPVSFIEVRSGHLESLLRESQMKQSTARQ